MQSKDKLRKEIKLKRKNISNKSEKDNQIYNLITNFKQYIKAETIYCYVPLKSEIDTIKLINYSFKLGKNVAVPYCIDANGNMDFYYINSIDDLVLGSFNIMEPNINKCQKAQNPTSAICIVPGLSFDKNGNRLGYGKGYYDRFIKNFSFICVGLCYNEFIVDLLPTNSTDQTVDYIVTQSKVYNCCSGGING